MCLIMVKKWTESKIKEQFALNNIDIMYRVYASIKKRWSGWKSFKRSVKTGNPPWPWDMPHEKVEWKVKKL